jgi:hypothetical protein
MENIGIIRSVELNKLSTAFTFTVTPHIQVINVPKSHQKLKRHLENYITYEKLVPEGGSNSMKNLICIDLLVSHSRELHIADTDDGV